MPPSPPGESQHRRKVGPLLALAVVLLAGSALGSVAWAQEPPVAGVLEARAADPQPRVRAEALARVLGASLSTDGDTLVLRKGGRALTLFAGSSDVLLAGGSAANETLSAPVQRDATGWWLPLDAGAPLGLVRTGETRVRGPDGRTWRLEVTAPRVTAASSRAEVVVLAPGARGVHLFAPGPSGEEDVLALWVSDLSLASLVVPGARAALDAALAEGGSQRGLLLIATSLTAGASIEGPALYAGSRRLSAPNERTETLAGGPDAVAPDRPWIAVAWLPPGVRLDRPVRVVWRGAEAEITFRD